MKKWNDFTRREKMIGVLVTGFAVLTVGGIGNAMSGSSPSPAPSPIQQQTAPITTYKEVQETEIIPFSKTSRNDGSMPNGEREVTTKGVNGVKTLTYTVTLVDGVETKRELIREEETKAPIDEVTTIGTYVAPVRQQAPSGGCDPNYSGACVPIASDVDCAGGSGNGPAYVSGPVYVVGTDIYGLDRDGDGVGCE